MSRGTGLALVLAAALALGAAAYFAVPGVRKEVDAVTAGASWTVDMWSAIRRVLPQLSTQAQMIVLAHAAYESGFGQARAAKRGFNVFNLTAGSAWRGEAWDDVGGDLEYDATGKAKRITQRWRIYPSLDNAIADYWQFLGPSANRGRYVKARAALEAGDVASFVEELHTAGYFTLAPAKYLAGLSGALGTVSGELA